MPDLKLKNVSKEVGPIAFEASGGGSGTISPRIALLRSAGIRLTATNFHGENVDWVAKDPFELL
ncbi:MAG: hypothetical protein GY757_29475 [bacterium]|nr:hypothetical protein [bacterium]